MPTVRSGIRHDGPVPVSSIHYGKTVMNAHRRVACFISSLLAPAASVHSPPIRSDISNISPSTHPLFDENYADEDFNANFEKDYDIDLYEVASNDVGEDLSDANKSLSSNDNQQLLDSQLVDSNTSEKKIKRSVSFQDLDDDYTHADFDGKDTIVGKQAQDEEALLDGDTSTPETILDNNATRETTAANKTIHNATGSLKKGTDLGQTHAQDMLEGLSAEGTEQERKEWEKEWEAKVKKEEEDQAKERKRLGLPSVKRLRLMDEYADEDDSGLNSFTQD
eukprot:TRINITY_DN57750_c0_g1_i1.p1 TRINITY_DN57750_c0_g1~~TRINITY_DN57750_c0_g1_i1.p1  ORF type:complete len:306 (-),score=59.26 TRINITY_DN57750_c0_g1_i1:35-871(-)